MQLFHSSASMDVPYKPNSKEYELDKIMECVPNFSEGRDLQKIDEIVSPFRAKAGVKLLDYSNDEDHNRLVVTVVGEPDALKEAVIEAIGIAVELIDLNHHQGQHPRMGAVDVVPFIPIKGCTMEDAIAVSKEVGQRVASQYNLPVFLYENQLVHHIVKISLPSVRRIRGNEGKDSPTRMASRFWSCGTSPHCWNCSHRSPYALSCLQYKSQYSQPRNSA